LWRIRREEAVISIVSEVISDDLSGFVDAEGNRVNTRWRIDAGVLPVAINKTVLWRDSATGLIKTGDLSGITDANRIGVNSAGKIENGVSTMAINKAMRRPAATRFELPDDRSELVDGSYDGADATWRIDRRISAVAVKEAVFVADRVVVFV